MTRQYLSGMWQKERSFSPAVVTSRAGRTIWVAGHGGLFDADHRMLKGDFDAQVRQAFTNIAASSDTNLAVVAGPIAEALFATAIGLVAAIPAVIAYNKLSSDAGKMIGRLEGFADEFSTILSRQLEARGR